MPWYPDRSSRRRRAIARDIALVVVLLALGGLGLRVHDSVDQLAGLGQGVERTGGAVRAGFQGASAAARVVPFVGGPIADALANAGHATGDNVASAGVAGEQSAHRLARVLGLLTWLLPSGLLLVLVLPRRIREGRDLLALRAALAAPDAPARLRLMALRAATRLPERDLLRHSPDPVADLAARRYDRLAAAALEHAGIDARAAADA